MKSLKKDFEAMTAETKRLDTDMIILRKDVGCVQENITTVRGSLDNTREKVAKIQNQVGDMEWQINSALKVSK